MRRIGRRRQIRIKMNICRRRERYNSWWKKRRIGKMRFIEKNIFKDVNMP